jgi:hypothetical protein
MLSYPTQDPSRLAIYSCHHLNLFTFLIQITLVYTDGIHPKKFRFCLATDALERCFKVISNTDAISSYPNDFEMTQPPSALDFV